MSFLLNFAKQPKKECISDFRTKSVLFVTTTFCVGFRPREG